ncbi:helix-turn-helix domain-containing protein [Methylorubrum extorquens]|uniref:helix-turn-helix domain-containing protein n=1 Tax=Methylorubrum extorquens TaxID=408 RepID=UPI00223870BC|nr:helix-turn-helix domain-containing protein [Methylorubrum extorquens]UYW25890.1 helix-turn-helix domain-containing protein [Methylorubrum extorquens]
MLSPFGKALREVRLDRGLLLKDMADGLRVTPSYLSAVETGRKSIPEDLINRIGNLINLSADERSSLERAYLASQSEIKIKIPANASDAHREAAALLARTFEGEPTTDFLEKFRAFLEKKR